MLPPWDDGTEYQSDFQLAEFLRTVDPDAVARDRRRIHIPTPHETLRISRRQADEARRRATKLRDAENRA